MKQVLRKAVTASRWSLVVFSALALTLSGASSAHRMFDAYQSPSEASGAEGDLAQILPGPNPDQLPQNMTPSGKPNSEPSAYLSAPLFTDSNNNESRIPGCSQHRTATISTSLRSENSLCLTPTAFQVSSHLGQQFTLVGAKPSGTS